MKTNMMSELLAARGLVMSQEEDQLPAEAATPTEAEAEVAEMVAAADAPVDPVDDEVEELVDEAGEVEDLDAGTDKLVEVAVQLEELYQDLSGMVARNEALNSRELRCTQYTVESLFQRLDIQVAPVLSNESINAGGMSATTLTQESVGDKLKSVLNSIGDALKKAKDSTIALWNRIFTLAGRWEARANKLKARVEGLEAGGKVVLKKNVIKALRNDARDGIVDPVKAMSQLQAATQYIMKDYTDAIVDYVRNGADEQRKPKTDKLAQIVKGLPQGAKYLNLVGKYDSFQTDGYGPKVGKLVVDGLSGAELVKILDEVVDVAKTIGKYKQGLFKTMDHLGEASRVLFKGLTGGITSGHGSWADGIAWNNNNAKEYVRISNRVRAVNSAALRVPRAFGSYAIEVGFGALNFVAAQATRK